MTAMSSSDRDRQQTFREGSGRASPAATAGGAGAGDDRLTPAEAIYYAIVDGIDAGGDQALADALELLGSRKGNQFDHAAAAIRRGRLSGRPTVDDSCALRRIADFPAHRKHQAVGIVAGDLAGPGATPREIHAIERRLRRKLNAQNKTDKSILSASSEV
jgi:hypothetical protein